MGDKRVWLPETEGGRKGTEVEAVWGELANIEGVAINWTGWGGPSGEHSASCHTPQLKIQPQAFPPEQVLQETKV